MRKIKNLVSVLLVISMMFSMVISPSAQATKPAMRAVELKSSLSEKSTVVNLNDLLGENHNDTAVIAIYDEHNKLIDAKTTDKFKTDENNNILIEYKDIQATRLVAYIWNSAASNITEKEPATELPNEVKDLVIHPGSNETMRRFTWYNTQETVGAKLQYALKSDYEKEGGFTDKNSVIVEGKTEVPVGNTKDLSCKAEIEGLKLGTEYVYRVGNSNTFDENVYSFKTHNVDKKQVFAIISDIHNTMKNYDSIQHEDAAKRIKYTTNIYNSLMKIHPETQFIISTGDNMSIGGNGYTVDDTNKESYRVIQELEMDQLFAPDIFKTVPFISATGNHETTKIGNPYGGVTRYHYNVPNEIYNEKGAIGAYTNTNQFGNWWFRNGDVLVIGILLHKTTKGGYYTNVTAAANKEYIQKALEANKDAKWKLIINHVPAYSSVIHTGEEDGVRDLYADLDLDNLDIDAVISGHQHSYSRSKQLLTNKYDDTEYIKYTNKKDVEIELMLPKIVSEDKIEHSTASNGSQIDTVTNPEGIVHIDVPSVTNRSHDCLVPDYKTIMAAHGTSFKEKMVYPDNTSVPVADLEDAIDVQPPSMLFVTVEKNKDGSEQIKFEYVHSGANTSKESSKFEVLDTYIIKKTSK